MSNVVELPTVKVRDRQAIDEIVAHLNQLHSEGKLKSIAAFYETHENDDHVYTWVSCTMSLAMWAYGIELLRKKLSIVLGGPRE